MLHNFIFFILILLTAGCGKKRPASLQFIDQARLIDIPIPPNINPVNLNYINQDLNNNFNNNITGQVTSLKFKTNLSFEQLKKFYLEHMELANWQLAWDACSTQQSSMIFQKPNKVCVLVIENLNPDNLKSSSKQNLKSSSISSSSLNCEVRLISGPRNQL